MYQGIADPIGLATTQAKIFIARDRAKYAPFVDATLQFAAENGLVVGGAAAREATLREAGDTEASGSTGSGSTTTPIELYSVSVVRHARALTDKLWRVDPDVYGRYTTLITKVPGQHLIVSVDERAIAELRAAPRFRGEGLDLGVAAAPSLPSRLQPILQLCQLWEVLASPLQAGEWVAALEAEQALRARDAVIGGRRGRGDGNGNREDRAGRDSSTRDSGRLRAGLMRALADEVLVGPVAAALMRGDAATGGRLQYVAEDDLGAVAERIAGAAKRAGTEVTWTIADPLYPFEPRLRKLTVWRDAGGRRGAPLVDVFNAAAFEAVPFVPAAAFPAAGVPESTRVGTVWAALRFRGVDWWTLECLARAGVIDAGSARREAAAILSDMADFGRARTRAEAQGRYDLVFPVESYWGSLVPRELYAKQLAAAARDRKEFPPPYMPAAAAARAARDSAEGGSGAEGGGGSGGTHDDIIEAHWE